MARDAWSSDFPANPVIEEYKKHLDVSLLVENLRRTPQERIEAIQKMNELIEDLRKGMPRPRSAT